MASLPRLHPRPVIIVLAVVAALGAMGLLLALHNADWRGDEYTYYDCARAVGRVLSGRSGDLAAEWDTVIGTGWFMPGICLMAAPPLAIAPDAPYWLLRGWMWLFSMALAGVLAWRLARHFGPWAAALLLLFPLLAPLWQVAALRLLPDLPAGLLIALALLLAAEVAAGLLRGEEPRWRRLLALQLCLMAALYLRGPTLLVAVVIDGALLVLALFAARRWIGRLVLAALVLPLLLSPWSVAASRHFNATVITTTNVPLVLADGFGDHAAMCRGPCPTGVGGDIWPAWHWARAEAARTGEHPLAIERQIMARALAGVTLGDYLATVRGNMGRFVLDPGQALRTQLPQAHAIPAGLKGPVYALLLALTLALYVPFMLALLLGNLLPLGRTGDDRIMALALKAVTACLFVQPFVHKSSGRYWTALAPLATLAAILLWRHWRQPATGQAVAGRWLDRVQLAYGALFAAVAAAVLLA